MVTFQSEYVTAGGNRHSAAAAWDAKSGILAFGAENNVALWKPLVVHASILDSRLAHQIDRMTVTKACKCYYGAMPTR